MQETVSTTLYRGMQWSQMRNGDFEAMSETTGGRYALKATELNKQGCLWDVRYGFPDKKGKPNVKIGCYADEETARVAAERHDYTYWSSIVTRTGGKPIFVGSGDGDMVENLGDNSEEITSLLIANADTADGTVFAKAASFFQASKGAFKQERNGTFSLTLSLSPESLPRWLLEAEPNADILIGALNLGGKKEEDWSERGQRALRRSFSLPNDNAFQNWMLHRYDRWKLISSAVSSGTSNDVESATAETLRRLLACPSRKDLLQNREAIDKLEQMDREFYTDLSRGYQSQP